MNDQTDYAFPPVAFDMIGDSTKASLATFSGAYANWLRGANRLQAEAIRFLGDRFNKDLQLLARATNCRQPGELLMLQSEAATQLVQDYLEEGTRWIALLGDGMKAAAKAQTSAKAG